jgi:hypothetical protein
VVAYQSLTPDYVAHYLSYHVNGSTFFFAQFKQLILESSF